MRIKLHDQFEFDFEPIDISQSELKSWRRCPLKWFFKHVWRLRPNTTTPPLAIGGMFHDTVAEWFDPTTSLEERTKELLLEIFKDVYRERVSNDFQDPDQKAFKLLYEILIHYHDEYAPDWEFVLVEQDFRVPIFLDEVVVGFIHGRLDGVVKKDDQLWIVEHKTTKRFSFDHLAMDLQADFYSLTGSKLFGEEFGGMVYDYIRTKPSKKRLNFARVPVVRSPTTLAVVESVLAHDLINLSRATAFQILPRPDRDCNWYCSYPTLCSARRAGLELKPLIKRSYHIREETEETF